MSLFPSIKTALVTQYIIFIIAYASALVVIRDRSYVLSFGRADDRGFVIAVKLLRGCLLSSIYSEFYMFQMAWDSWIGSNLSDIP